MRSMSSTMMKSAPRLAMQRTNSAGHYASDYRASRRSNNRVMMLDKLENLPLRQA
jgi:hypothetical protein